MWQKKKFWSPKFYWKKNLKPNILQEKKNSEAKNLTEKNSGVKNFDKKNSWRLKYS